MRRESVNVKWNRIKANNPVGKSIEALIVAKTANRVILNVGRDGIGFLRDYKISKSPKYMETEFPKTGYAYVVVDGYDDERKQLEFSILDTSQIAEALKQLDPENNEFITKVRCRVISHRNNGFYVVLESGIDGFLPVAEIPDVGHLRPEQILYVDDIIDALVTTVDYNTSLAFLSIKKLWVDGPNQLRPAIAHEFRPPQMKEELTPKSYKDYEYGERRQVLLLDDTSIDADITRSLLQQQGHVVYHIHISTDAFDKALELLACHTFDCVVSDMKFKNLPFDGVELCEKIHNEYPGLPFIFFSRFTGEEAVSRISDSPVTGLDMLDKFSDLGILGQVVATLERCKQQEHSQHATEVILNLGDLDQNFYVDCYDKAKSLFTDIKMAVFCRDQHSKEYELVYSKGIDLADYRKVAYDIKHSPINDVILGDSQIYAPDLEEVTGFEKIRNIRENKSLTSFNCFAGFPLRVMGRKEYGLFFFHERESGFDSYVELLRLAHELAMNMEDVRLTEKTLDKRHINQISNILPTMLHELNKSVMLHNVTAGRVAEVIREIHSKETPDQDWDRLFDIVDSLDEQTRELASTLEEFLMSFKLGKTESGTSVSESLGNTMRFLKHTAFDIYNVSLTLEYIDHQLDNILTEPKRLFHALMNILFNAFYHTHQVHKTKGKVIINASYESDDKIRPVKIRVKDNGIGIHHEALSHIFKPYYTTKPKDEGSGLGLYIARKCVEDMDGRLFVEDTAMYSGTTFLIEIPEGKIWQAKKREWYEELYMERKGDR